MKDCVVQGLERYPQIKQSYKSWERAEQRIRKARGQERDGIRPEDRADWVDKQKVVKWLRSESERQSRQAEEAQSLPSGTASAAPPVSESASSGLVEVASTASETVAGDTFSSRPPNDPMSTVLCGVIPQPTPEVARSRERTNRARARSPAGSGSASVRAKTPLPESGHRKQSSNELPELRSPASGAQAKRAETSDDVRVFLVPRRKKEKDGGGIEPKPASKKMPRNAKACASTGPPTAVPQDPALWRSVKSAPPRERDIRWQLGFDVGSTPPDDLCHVILVHCYGRENSDRDPRHFWLNVEWDRDEKDKKARDRKADRCFLPPT